MKIEQATLEVTRSGTFQERGFTIDGNAKAFDILSSKIYTDVPLAIVRELSTNASDSHKDAGNADQPFDVHLPNTLEPWFTIRDYGTGLSPENVETIYTTYFKSTRTGSDDFTGCLGLGSKSPFAYTEQFTIVSNWNGRKYTYSAFKNEQSCPSLALLSEVETDEANGLEIRIAIKPGDTQTFANAAKRVYPYFKVRPNIKGAQLTLEKLKPAVSNDTYALYDNHAGTNTFPSTINVVMGQVCYSVDSDKVKNRLGYSACIVLQMPMGSCSIAASREEIHYDQRTIRNVQTAMDAAMEHAETEIIKQVDDPQSPMLFRLMKLTQSNRLMTGLMINGLSRIESVEAQKYELKTCGIRRGDKLFIQPNHSYFSGGDYEDKIFFIEEDADITQNLKNRIRQFMNQTKAAAGRTAHSHEFRFYLAKIQDQARFAELFGTPTTKLSLLPDVPRTARDNSRTSARSKPIKLMKEEAHDNMSFEWDSVMDAADVKPKDACCVPRDGNWIVWNGQNVKPSHIRHIAKALGFERVYGIATKRYDSLRVKLGIEALDEVAKDRAEAKIKSLDLYALAAYDYDCPVSSGYFDFKKLKGLSTECDDFIKMMESKFDNLATYRKLSEVFNIKLPTAPKYGDMFFKKYPILLALDWYRGHNTMKMVSDYIKLVEGI